MKKTIAFLQAFLLLILLIPVSSVSAASSSYVDDLFLKYFGNAKAGDMELTIKQQFDEIKKEYQYSNTEYLNKISGLFYNVSGTTGLDQKVKTRFSKLNTWNAVFFNGYEDKISAVIPFNNYNIEKSADWGDTDINNTGYALIPRNIFLIPDVANSIDPSSATKEQKNYQINWMMDKLNKLDENSFGVYRVDGRTNIAIARIASEMGGLFQSSEPYPYDKSKEATDPHGLMIFRMTPYPSFTKTEVLDKNLSVTYKAYGYVDHTNYVKLVNKSGKEKELRKFHVSVGASDFNKDGDWKDGTNVEFSESFNTRLEDIRSALGTGEMKLIMNDGFGRLTEKSITIPEAGAPNLKITTVKAVCDKNNQMTISVTVEGSAEVKSISTQLTIKADGRVLSTETITLTPGEPKIITKVLPCDNSKIVETEVNPDKKHPENESNWDDNKKDTEVLKPTDPGQVSIDEKSLQMKFGKIPQPVRLTSSFTAPVIVTNNSSKPKTTTLNFTMKGTMNQSYQIPHYTCGPQSCWTWYETKYRNLPLTISGKSPTLTVPAYGSVTWNVSSGLNYTISGGDPSAQYGMNLNVWGPGSEYGVPDSSARYFPEIKVTADNGSEYLNPTINMFIETNYGAQKPKPPVLTE